MIIFWAGFIMAATLYVCGDLVGLDMGAFADASPTTVYAVSTVMILLTLALVPLALRLTKMRRVRDDLTSRGAQALAKWGTLRLLVLLSLLVVNTFLYYVFGFEPTFGYLAVIVVLTLPFVYPTMDRCLAETSGTASGQ